MPHKHQKDRNAAYRKLFSDPIRKEFRRVYMARWNRENPGWSNLTRLLRKYDITLDQYHAKAESQDFACGICKKDDAVLVIDHDHETGRFRGLLCDPCNKVLGFLRDSHMNIVSASAYLGA